jgi:hypothetical protein
MKVYCLETPLAGVEFILECDTRVWRRRLTISVKDTALNEATGVR